MYCDQFEHYGLLFLSEELSKPERSNYLKHLKSCHECRDILKSFQNTWTIINKIKNEIPDSEISKKIIIKSRNIGNQPTLAMKIRSNRQISWILGFPSIAVASILIYLLIKSLTSPHFMVDPVNEWQDHFYSEVSYINSEIDRVRSGDLLPYYSIRNEEENDSIEFLYPMSNDLESIRGDVENLIESINGI